MERRVSAGLKTTFLVHFIVAAIYGLLLVLYPQMWGNLAGIVVEETDPYRLVGAALLAFAVGSWLAYRETAWEKVRIMVQVEIAWTVIAALVILWGLVFVGLPPLEWMNVAFLSGFAAAFGFFYLRAREG